MRWTDDIAGGPRGHAGLEELAAAVAALREDLDATRAELAALRSGIWLDEPAPAAENGSRRRPLRGVD